MKYHRPLQPVPYSLTESHQKQISALFRHTTPIHHARSCQRLVWLSLSIVWFIGLWTSPAIVIAQNQQDTNHYLVVRYDDYSPRIPMHQVTAGDELETRLFEMFRRHQAKLVVGVIPYPVIIPTEAELDPAYANLEHSWLAQPDNPWLSLLREYISNGTIEPALHGYEHRRHPTSGYRHGEYRLQPYAWQLESLRQAQKILSSSLETPIEIFVPPWNAWDANTARAMEELEFTWLSPDLHHAEYSGDTLNVAPQCTANPALALKWMQNDPNLPDQTVMVLVTHPFDFKGEQGEAYFQQLEELLAYVNTADHWQCVGLTDLPDLQSSSWAQRFRKAVTWDHAQQIIHDTLAVSNFVSQQPVFFMPTHHYDSQTWQWQVMIYIAMLITACIGGAIAWIASRLIITHRQLLLIASLLTTGLLIFLVIGAIKIASTGYLVRGIRWQAIAGCAGVMTTLWIIWNARQPTNTKSVSMPKDHPTTDSLLSVEST